MTNLPSQISLNDAKMQADAYILENNHKFV